ncbi:MAG: thermonuclease family protein, partial [Pleurocapsa sp.]
MKQIFIIAIASVFFKVPALANTYRVTDVIDGDTIKVTNLEKNSTQRVRLACIDAPEADQPQGKLSQITLASFIPIGSNIELNIVDMDKYGRSVAEVMINNVIVNQSMLKKGQAIVYQQYLDNCADATGYLAAEREAKQNKIGFWQDVSFVNPQDWRQGNRSVV